MQIRDLSPFFQTRHNRSDPEISDKVSLGSYILILSHCIPISEFSLPAVCPHAFFHYRQERKKVWVYHTFFRSYPFSTALENAIDFVSRIIKQTLLPCMLLFTCIGACIYVCNKLKPLQVGYEVKCKVLPLLSLRSQRVMTVCPGNRAD